MFLRQNYFNFKSLTQIADQDQSDGTVPARRKTALEEDFGRCADPSGTSGAAAIDDVHRPVDTNRFRRANPVQAGTDWLFGRAVSVLQIPHHVCQR